MAKNVSNRKNLTVNLRSHAKNASKSKQKLNLQVVTIDGKKVKVSAREKKSITA